MIVRRYRIRNLAPRQWVKYMIKPNPKPKVPHYRELEKKGKRRW